MDGMVFVVPLVIVFVLFGLASGSGFIMVLTPVVLFGSLAAAFITFVLREGRRAPNRSVRQLPTNHLQRQMYMALRPRRPKRPKDEDPE
jgi:hypothetical protein